jgi:hypothetical protein
MTVFAYQKLTTDNVIELLQRLHDYMDNKSDVEIDEYGQPAANLEGIFAADINEALSFLIEQQEKAR